ncbi:hypothetical protein CAPTEDRAFT_207528 [Capitella teleta]|uniref:Uncharacterized protein n=1 Tax=Capitella teleta TaxID=283909 RepID=R7V5D2_CAPTE|nr:hypothetical protein CAPTEDRAFT_207528 [Capitella teleta]|eukprot:ELU14073.1 hypothetical protein CAPTEDRAFT_207528 [Capitella teleta]
MVSHSETVKRISPMTLLLVANTCLLAIAMVTDAQYTAEHGSDTAGDNEKCDMTAYEEAVEELSSRLSELDGKVKAVTSVMDYVTNKIHNLEKGEFDPAIEHLYTENYYYTTRSKDFF